MFAEVLEKMGATLTWEANAMTVSRDIRTAPLKGVDVDCGEIPDAAMTLAVGFAPARPGTREFAAVWPWVIQCTPPSPFVAR